MFVDHGAPPLKITIGAVSMLFEDHRVCGPLPVNAGGDGLNVPGRHPFWTAVTAWSQQGKRVIDGECLFVWPKDLDEVTGRIKYSGEH